MKILRIRLCNRESEEANKYGLGREGFLIDLKNESDEDWKYFAYFRCQQAKTVASDFPPTMVGYRILDFISSAYECGWDIQLLNVYIKNERNWSNARTTNI